ncbi:MAG: bifunctional precorrin-2 dehydrogenase/sirohydrochlorin ferrochelatase [Bacteroidetes bacterium]|nr:MAG: bifunctional precorrin-2 dehydrogenase/sirohydrochlorin ferrochelatase [Bacteroidota bacterium]
MNHNPLYPVFLKAHELQFLIVGGGNVGLEKLHFLLKSSPQANVKLVATEISEALRAHLRQLPGHRVVLVEKSFEASDLSGADLVIAATNDLETNRKIRNLARRAGILVNVADTPALCDFYLGGIVTKGNLKIAISTNGKSPTFAKRFRQLLEEILPEDIDPLLGNLRIIRDRLAGDFARKVEKLNRLTASLIQ